MKRRCMSAWLRRLWFGATVLAIGVHPNLACRQGQPNNEPKMPPNSPIPEIERKEPDRPKTPALPRSGDAG